MEGIIHPASARLAAIMRDRPEAVICRVEGILRAWIPDEPDSLTGYLKCAYTEDELAAKLDGG